MASLSKSRWFLGTLLLAALGVGCWLIFQTHVEKSNVRLPADTRSPLLPTPEQSVAASVSAPTGSVPPPSPVPLALRSSTPVITPPTPTPPVSANSSQPPTAPANVAAAQPAEVRSTRAMYMAHAPLRTPEVVDPDSETNRRILQTMVEKSLTHSETAR